MLDITIITVGKVKESYWRLASQEYEKRFQPYGRLRIIELEATPFSDKTKDQAKKKEALKITASLAKQSGRQIYLLAERGEEFDSLELASCLNKNQPLTLVIGGALGFTSQLYSQYRQISLGRLTMPHELARVVLLEQLYRAATILNKKNYHY